MFRAVAERMMKIIGKEAADQGIVTVGQLPAAIEALKAAIAADRAMQARPAGGTRPGVGPELDEHAGADIRLAQRAQPLLELFQWSLKDEKPVTWRG